MAQIFGIFAGAVGILGFILDNIPSRPNQYEASFRFGIGLDRSGGLSNAGGDAPDIRLWNEVGQFLGARYDPGRVSSGQFKDVTVGLSSPHQPTYALFTGNDDGVCIAYITSSWADGGKYGWIGNWADDWACRRPWYYANVYIDNRLLNCAWLDRNGDTEVTAFQVHFPEFKPDQNPSGNKEYFCAQNPSLQFYYHWEPNAISYWVGPRKPGSPVAENSEIAFSQGPVKPGGMPLRHARIYNETRLVQSSHAEHSAIKLCESSTSSGPDFVSLHEAKFCDMTTREVFPLCLDKGTTDCFDTATKRVRLSEGTVKTITGQPVSKDYSAVLEWGRE